MGTKPKSALALARGNGGKIAPPPKKESFTDFLGSQIIIHQIPNDKVGKPHKCESERVVCVFYHHHHHIIKYISKQQLFVNNASDMKCVCWFSYGDGVKGKKKL